MSRPSLSRQTALLKRAIAIYLADPQLTSAVSSAADDQLIYTTARAWHSATEKLAVIIKTGTIDWSTAFEAALALLNNHKQLAGGLCKLLPQIASSAVSLKSLILDYATWRRAHTELWRRVLQQDRALRCRYCSKPFRYFKDLESPHYCVGRHQAEISHRHVDAVSQGPYVCDALTDGAAPIPCGKPFASYGDYRDHFRYAHSAIQFKRPSGKQYVTTSGTISSWLMNETSRIWSYEGASAFLQPINHRRVKNIRVTPKSSAYGTPALRSGPRPGKAFALAALHGKSIDEAVLQALLADLWNRGEIKRPHHKRLEKLAPVAKAVALEKYREITSAIAVEHNATIQQLPSPLLQAVTLMMLQHFMPALGNKFESITDAVLSLGTRGGKHALSVTTITKNDFLTRSQIHDIMQRSVTNASELENQGHCEVNGTISEIEIYQGTGVARSEMANAAPARVYSSRQLEQVSIEAGDQAARAQFRAIDRAAKLDSNPYARTIIMDLWAGKKKVQIAEERKVSRPTIDAILERLKSRLNGAERAAFIDTDD